MSSEDYVRPLTPEELNDLRKEMAVFAISDARKDELVHIIDGIVISFVDQAYGIDPVQLSLAARANKQFQSGEISDNKEDIPKHESQVLDPLESPSDSKSDRRFER